MKPGFYWAYDPKDIYYRPFVIEIVKNKYKTHDLVLGCGTPSVLDLPDFLELFVIIRRVTVPKEPQLAH